MDILSILTRESESHQNRIYVYEVDGKWYAYEHSAVLISKLLKGIVTLKQFINDTYEIIIRSVEIELDMLIELLIDSHTITSCSDKELILALPTKR